MMGKSHAKQGVCAIVLLAALLIALNIPLGGQTAILGLSALLLVGGSTYPDIDAEGSHATKSYGWLSHLVHSITHLLTQAIYHASLGHLDRKKKGSHRLLTHTAIGNVLASTLR